MIFINREVEARYNEHKDYIKSIYYDLYEDKKSFERLEATIIANSNERSVVLSELDMLRTENKDWFLSNEIVGMMLYVDLFNNDLNGVKEKIPYFIELGINYIHLMPILKMPKEHNDGGYAVSSYKEIDEKFGSMEEFESLTKALRENNINLCIDFVINHTSDEHEWALLAKKGSIKHQNMYMMYDTDEVPKKYDKTVQSVFPKIAPGNFTYNDKLSKYIFTSFYPFQWDLNFKNEDVIINIVDSILFLANKGVDVLRLDAIPFLWKELGTNCRNLENVHKVIRLLKAITEVVCPSMIFKGEAIVAPKDILTYFGTKNHKECQTMYNASLMVQLWGAIATENAKVISNTILRSPELPDLGTWINYIRCHDDIGWGFDEEVLVKEKLEPEKNKQHMISFYNGDYKDSFAKGELYEFDPNTLDARNSGTLASLSGLEKAINENNETEIEMAINRIVLMHSIILSIGGIPMIYSGDEIGQLNDYDYKKDYSKMKDSRWLHRREMKWNNYLPYEIEIRNKIKRVIDIRKSCKAFDSSSLAKVKRVKQSKLFVYEKDNILVICNFSKKIVNFDIEENYYDLVNNSSHKKLINLGPYEFFWLEKETD